MIAVAVALLAQDVAASSRDAGPLIAWGGTIVSGGAIARYFLGRFSQLEDKVNRTAEDVSLVLGHLGIERPPRK